MDEAKSARANVYSIGISGPIDEVSEDSENDGVAAKYSEIHEKVLREAFNLRVRL